MHKRLLSLLFLVLTVACSDFDEKDFTVLLPEAGEDLVFFTAESGNVITLNGSQSSDVNDLGFDFQWEVTAFPEGFEPSLQEANTAHPTLIVNENASGRYTLSLTIFRGAQRARDFINVDVNPLIAQVLLVNAIAGENSAILSIPSLGITSNPTAALSADQTYHALNLNEAQDSEGNVLLEVTFQENILPLEAALEALGSYTLYLVGTEANPELLLIEKQFNQNTIPPGLVGLDAVNLVPELENMVLFIDATAAGFGVLPVDVLFQGLGITQTFGSLSFGESGELLFPASNLLPLPIWATVNGERVSNDANILLPLDVDGNFGTFVLFADPSSEFGNRLTFITNSNLLPTE